MLELNRDNFDAEVLETKELVLVDFWGPQCRPCLALMPAVEQLEKDFSGKLKVAKVNGAQNRMLCAKLKVMGLPCFLLYKGGVEVKRLLGEQITKECLKKNIEKLSAWRSFGIPIGEEGEFVNGFEREEGHRDRGTGWNSGASY